MEKYARQAVSEGVKNAEDLRVGGDSEIYRVLNLHYNRNNHIEVWGPQVRKYTETRTGFVLLVYIFRCNVANFLQTALWLSFFIYFNIVFIYYIVIIIIKFVQQVLFCLLSAINCKFLIRLLK